MSINLVILGGRVGEEPKLRSAVSNPELQIANFSLATHKAWDANNERKSKTNWHRIVIMGGKLIDVAKYIGKNSYITVMGELQTRKIEDATSQAKYITEVIATRIVLSPKEQIDNEGLPKDDGINMIMLAGRLGEDPKLRSAVTNPDLQIANFSVATNKEWTANNERKTKTSWHRIVIMGGKLIDLGKFLKKGDYITVIGELQTRKIEDAQNPDQPRYITEVIASRIIPGPKAQPGSASGNNSDKNHFGLHSSDDNGIMFGDFDKNTASKPAKNFAVVAEDDDIIFDDFDDEKQ